MTTTTKAVTILLFGLNFQGSQELEIIVDLDDLHDVLTAKGFGYSSTEEDDHCDIESYYAANGQNVDLYVWHIVPKGFSPINAQPLEILA
jgi:hypothetical protein